MRFPTYSATQHRAALGHADYFRLATLGLAVHRVVAEDTPGALAEVGVWRGDMSVFIHQVAPQRSLYLFDTFTGFPAEDLSSEQSGDARFRDTSAQAVRGRLGPSADVRLRPGRVPGTFKGLEDERFAFVLVDLDLHAPTMASLEFFYPRLSCGGYIVVHDYNNPESGWACRRAVDEFLADKPEHLIELADVWGSVLFRKF